MSVEAHNLTMNHFIFGFVSGTTADLTILIPNRPGPLCPPDPHYTWHYHNRYTNILIKHSPKGNMVRNVCTTKMQWADFNFIFVAPEKQWANIAKAFRGQTSPDFTKGFSTMASADRG